MSYKIELSESEPPPAPESPSEPRLAAGLAFPLPSRLRDTWSWLRDIMHSHPHFREFIRLDHGGPPAWVTDLASNTTHRFVAPTGQIWWVNARYEFLGILPPPDVLEYGESWIEHRIYDPDYFTLHQATKAHPRVLACDPRTLARTVTIAGVPLPPPVLRWLRAVFASVLTRWAFDLDARAHDYRSSEEAS